MATIAVGGRTLLPMYQPINSKLEGDKELDSKMEEFMQENVPVMSREDLRRREVVLGRIRAIFLQWVIDSSVAAGIPEDSALAAGGKIYTSGSYRLRIHEPGSDIDTICVAPQHCTRHLFFSDLKERLIKEPQVENINAIETAAVPIITFDFDGINIDLGLACLPVSTVPPTLDIDDDSLLLGVDNATEKCVNGPRVTNMIHRLVPNYDSFLPVVRCVRKWAKTRGMYSNKMGYLGGVNFNIMVAFASQMYPKAGPSTLIQRFFKLMAGWGWPNAIQLVQPHTDPNIGLEVWNFAANRWHVMPIITPAYPGMNSAANVSRFTLDVMVEEFKRGHEIIAQVLEKGGQGWERLFEPSDFFIKYSHYLAVDIMASSEADHRSWLGWVESRIRKLVENLGVIPFKRIHLFPKKVEACVGGGIAGELPAHCVAYFIGLEVDRRRVREGQTLDVEKVTSRFRTETTAIATNRGFLAPGMDIMVTSVPWKQLPGLVFDTLGGREAATATRREARRARTEEKKRKLADIAAAAPKPQAQKGAAAAEGGEIAAAGEEDDGDAETSKPVSAAAAAGLAPLARESSIGGALGPGPALPAPLKPEALEGEGEEATGGEGELVLSGVSRPARAKRRKQAVEVINLVDLVPVVPKWKHHSRSASGVGASAGVDAAAPAPARPRAGKRLKVELLPDPLPPRKTVRA